MNFGLTSSFLTCSDRWFLYENLLEITIRGIPASFDSARKIA
jgi:hypothetical protein